MKRTNPAISIDDFIATFPAEVQLQLQQLRQIIHQVAPDAIEAISYGIPTFKLHGNLVHFSGYEKHLGLYPGAEAVEHFADKLKTYECSKGTIRFPLDKPLPEKLIKEIVQFRVKKQLEKKK